MGRATVRLQRRMASLKGRRIVVTRAREQAGELARALEARGAEPVLAPVIRIQPLENLGALRAALTGLSAYRWVVFTSQNAVQVVLDRLVAWGLTPRVFSSTSVAAIGSVTADGLAGQVELSTVNGSVKAAFAQLKKSVSLKSVNGSVTVALPPETNAKVSAHTLTGGINSDFALQAKKHFPIGQNLDGKLGEGGPAVNLSTVNGAIRIDRSKAVALENR